MPLRAEAVVAADIRTEKKAGLLKDHRHAALSLGVYIRGGLGKHEK
jgi:hypothetical protein